LFANPLGAGRTVATAILFDLGNTLVSYYRRDEFHGILEHAIRNVLEELQSRDRATVSYDHAIDVALSENRESDDYRVKPMLDRLKRVFALSPQDISSMGDVLCSCFLEPIFAIGRVYEDTIPALQKLRLNGYRTAIVSNLPWGSPPEAWRHELQRLGLASLVDSITLCGEVGWRKPAPQIFEAAARSLGVPCDQCTFVGDNIEWDIEGSSAVGMRPVLIDRENEHSDCGDERISDLMELV
jgi:putative hydrolase of the HAD superfamily